MGLAALQAGNVSEAIEHFQAAAAADPAAIALWMNLAKAQRLAGNDEAERAALDHALAIDQLHLMALIRMAELHERRGEMGGARTVGPWLLACVPRFQTRRPSSMR